MWSITHWLYSIGVSAMNESLNKKQKLLKFAIFISVGLVFVFLSSMIILDYIKENDPSNKVKVTEAHLPLDGIDPKEIWVNQLRNENNLIRSENNQIRLENEIVQSKVDFIQEMVLKKTYEESEIDKVARSEIEELKNSLENLRAELRNSASTNSLNETLREELHRTSINHRQSAIFDPFDNQPIFQQPALFPAQELFTPLTSVICTEQMNLHHVDRSIPAGTTVKAILLSSVDMPCGVKGSTDPLPVKLRIIADGKLPHRVRARLKSGIITACVYGDLSSERVYFRLEKLTQVRADGFFIETQVAGYVSGEDGKYGLRGTVVDKSAELVENALFSGFMSGVSSFFEAAALAKLNPVIAFDGNSQGSCSPPSWKQSAGQLAISGGSGGMTNALDELTDYFIRRAEQLRPVIQITPGRIVDITFSDSADLGDLYTHERVRSSGIRG
jgi:conjugal transfer pilus assembly protein TraB